MRQKLQKYRKDIRKKEHEAYFQQKREFILRCHDQENSVVIETDVNIKPRQYSNLNSEIDREETQKNEADIYQQWKLDQKNIEIYLASKQYSKILVIATDIYNTLREVRSPNNMLNWKKTNINHFFLRTNILSNIVKAVICAQKDQCSSGTLQSLSVKGVSILKHFLAEEPTDFTEELYLQSDLLLFLRVCISEPKFDKNHLSRIIYIIIQMIYASISATGELFHKMNDMDNDLFNFSAPFFNISKLPLEPEEQLTINFLIMVKLYLQQIDDSISQAKQNKNEQQRISLNLTHFHIDMCFQLSIKSVHYFLKTNFMQTQETLLCMEEALEVLKLLVENSNNSCKWLDRIDYKGLVNLLRYKQCPAEIAYKIFVIVDHLIVNDTNDEKFTFEFVKSCELVTVIWTLKNEYYGFVINILSNLATMSDFKKDLEPYVHNIFISLKYQSNNYHLYQFIYNWFSSQNFEIRESKDQLIVSILGESTETDEKIIDLESLLWLQLIRNNELRVPLRILEHDNHHTKSIRQILMPNEQINSI